MEKGLEMIKINELKALRLLEEEDVKSLRMYIEEEIKKQSTTSTSEKQRLSTFIRLAKEMKKVALREHKLYLAGAVVDDGYLHISDGFRIVSYSDLDIPVEMLKSDVKPPRYKDIYPDCTKYGVEIEFDLTDIELSYKRYKSKPKGNKRKSKIYHYENDKLGCVVGIDVVFLYEMTKVLDFENSTIYARDAISPIIILENSGKNKGLILPVYLPESDNKGV